MESSGEICGVAVVSDRHRIGSGADSETGHICTGQPVTFHSAIVQPYLVDTPVWKNSFRSYDLKGVCSGEIRWHVQGAGSAMLQAELHQLWHPNSSIAGARTAIL